MIYIATVYVEEILLTPGSEMPYTKLTGPFVRKYELRVPQDFRYLAIRDLNQQFPNLTGVEVGPISVAKKQELPFNK